MPGQTLTQRSLQPFRRLAQNMPRSAARTSLPVTPLPALPQSATSGARFSFLEGLVAVRLTVPCGIRPLYSSPRLRSLRVGGAVRSSGEACRQRTGPARPPRACALPTATSRPAAAACTLLASLQNQFCLFYA